MAPPHDPVPKAVASRWGLSFVLSGVMIVIYVTFVMLVAFQRELLARQLAPGLSLGVLLGALVIVSAWVLTFIYVRRANRV